jgi:hypothetical protein
MSAREVTGDRSYAGQARWRLRDGRGTLPLASTPLYKWPCRVRPSAPALMRVAPKSTSAEPFSTVVAMGRSVGRRIGLVALGVPRATAGLTGTARGRPPHA